MLAAFAFSLIAQTAMTPNPRVHELLDANWRFAKVAVSPMESGIDVVWQWAPLPDNIHPESYSPGNPAWNATPAKPGDDIFHGRVGFALLRTTLTIPPDAAVLHFESVDDNATVFFNGHLVMQHEGWNDPFDVPLDSVRGAGTVTVDVIDENTAGPGGIGPIRFDRAETTETPKEALPDFNDADWRTVHLPHDYVIEGKFNPADDPGHGALARGKAWYRRSIDIPASARGKSVWIDFEGAYSDAHVWFNGHFLGRHRSGYTGFSFDLTPYANFGGRNEISVHLDANKTEGWWYEGGGIYRHVWLTIADRAHIAPLDGVYVTTKVADPLDPHPAAIVHVSVHVVNARTDLAHILARNYIVGPDGTRTEPQVTSFSASPGEAQISSDLPVEDARLWSIERPNLYTLVSEITTSPPAGGGTPQVIDRVETPFGIRTIRFDANQGFFLNGKPVKLKGTCNHQDFAGVGIAMPDTILEWRIRKLKELGSNAYRCSHNEVAPELLDACDRLGMVVMDENREFGDTWTGKANERTTTHDLSDLRQEILRDRNHPSVIMWSLCNEEFSVQTTAAGGRLARTLGSEVRKLDPTRPITAALNGGHGHEMSAALDLEGFNYGPWEYDRYHKAHPHDPMFGSETASTTTTRGEYAVDKVRGYVPAYDTQGADTAEDAWQPIAERPFMAGAFVWTGFDYKGEPSPYGWPCVNSHYGIIDMCGFWKDVAYYYKAWWDDRPSVHVFPNWTWPGQEGKPIKVWAFGNGDSVELLVNGVSQGRLKMPKYRHVEWTVPYAPGAIEARCYQGDRLIAVDRQETTGAPVALRITASSSALRANDEDCAMLTVSAVDAKGRIVPTADNLVTFSAKGPAAVVGVGNGDPSSHEPDRAAERHVFHGLCMGILQAAHRAGTVRVTVSSPGLRPATCTVRVRGE